MNFIQTHLRFRDRIQQEILRKFDRVWETFVDPKLQLVSVLIMGCHREKPVLLAFLSLTFSTKMLYSIGPDCNTDPYRKYRWLWMKYTDTEIPVSKKVGTHHYFWVFCLPQFLTCDHCARYWTRVQGLRTIRTYALGPCGCKTVDCYGRSVLTAATFLW